MPTSKSRKGSGNKAGKPAAVKSGPLPPYGTSIRQAIARGDSQEMRRVALSTRQYLSRVQSALQALEKTIAKSRS